MKKLLEKLGFGGVLNSGEETQAVSLSEINPVPLLGRFDSGFALADYSISQGSRRKRTKVGDLLYRFKYERSPDAGLILAELASDFINRQSSFRSSHVMLTVPPSFKSRSLDPVSLVAERIEERTQIRWERDALRRTRLTKPQKALRDRALKKLNVFSTFRPAKPLNLNGKKVLLIDDICASGATLNDISDILREGKAAEINVLVLARTQFSVRIGSSS
ncbi:MAG: phosphoribosyltransferase family protein [Candidatus Zixiibacteriota bacterium]